MNSLEFIKSRIEFFEEKIKEEEQELKIMKTEDKHIINSYNNRIDILKEKKEIYEQIKTKLEAWEVVKSAITQKLQITGKYRDKIVEINHRIYVEGTEQYDKLKKALEVE